MHAYNHKSCGGAYKYEDICESIKLVQLPFGNHPDTKRFLALRFVYSTHFSIEKINENFEKKKQQQQNSPQGIFIRLY